MNLSRAKNVILPFDEIGSDDVRFVGAKNAAIGDRLRQSTDTRPRFGFATTAKAFQLFLDQGGLRQDLAGMLASLDASNPERLAQVGRVVRERVLAAPLPESVIEAVSRSFERLEDGRKVSVRSSASADDLPGAGFSGQYEVCFNVSGVEEAALSIKRCYAAVFSDRAISYRARHGLEQMAVSLSVGVQAMRIRECPVKKGIRALMSPKLAHQVSTAA